MIKSNGGPRPKEPQPPLQAALSHLEVKEAIIAPSCQLRPPCIEITVRALGSLEENVCGHLLEPASNFCLPQILISLQDMLWW